MKEEKPDLKIAISFFSPSGFEIQKNYALADLVFYLPMAIEKNAKEVLHLLKPDKIFFIKYEFWLNYISQAYKENIPVYLVSALFDPSQFFFKWYGKIFYNILDKYSVIFVQDRASHDLLSSYNINSIISGDTRFDRVMTNKIRAKENKLISAFLNNKKLIVLGSSWQTEEDLIMNVYDPNLNYKIVIAPHDIKREIKIPAGILSIKYSEIGEIDISDHEVLIIDNIGMLSTLYRYSSFAFVGGGFRGSLHNILEAAVFGIPVIYGPQTQKHPEAEALEDAGGGFIIHDDKELQKIIYNFITDEVSRASAGSDSYNFIERNCGATYKIISEI
jgi:3-deoxy-D-manno-octulosonic-acid transferase